MSDDILAEGLEALSTIDEPLEIIDIGFELPKVDVPIEGRHKPELEADPADAPADVGKVERVARLDDIWLLGREQLSVGNALKSDSDKALLAEPQRGPRVDRLGVQASSDRFQGGVNGWATRFSVRALIRRPKNGPAMALRLSTR